MYKATIIENSLSDARIFDRLVVEKTWKSDDWILHDVFVEEEQIPELQKSLDDGPWYIHLWKAGVDEVIVVFKDAIFTIKFSDKTTWMEAVAHGKSLGIPNEQLDFSID